MDQKGSRYQEDMLKMELLGASERPQLLNEAYFILFLYATRSEGLLHPGAVVVADNVLKPGALRRSEHGMSLFQGSPLPVPDHQRRALQRVAGML